ncbi:hypothetical protein HHK36_027295 [Tetracentron sinense]|uniref:SAM domain-containing protein n=1 Tax=Tetracentron sinense TaxID=13715 RepID=A0A835D306_TETSI|nr:hypothetical protein HHK36_027295 [Tetracentron sinense]
MLVLSMNSKRQGHPNVWFGEIGDVSAAFSCGTSHKIKEILEQKRWNHDVENPRETEFNYIYGISMQRSSEIVVSSPGMLSMILADMMHNRENRNPNSSKSYLNLRGDEFVGLTSNGLCKGPKTGCGYGKMGIGGSAVNSVRRWLDELGFSKYAGIFEMHEVDEEVLSLLTFEDFKEMGINAIGPRRKMYAAIKHLREGEGCLFDG